MGNWRVIITGLIVVFCFFSIIFSAEAEEDSNVLTGIGKGVSQFLFIPLSSNEPIDLNTQYFPDYASCLGYYQFISATERSGCQREVLCERQILDKKKHNEEQCAVYKNTTYDTSNPIFGQQR